ncbi:PLP-dependent aminotransferase family protein [Iamia sp. SCSIO 61187]|uniref:aminotransferase-like domain-containing protein n=1 Tax=Iamia sp. SCSIO 61187 TaxID=2722752 RepID=UPI001C625153|nr:PLP-dependent aminotransferase family protein [Iamia sp. SCSIO 61187]QYG92195.1 PLP-dependent aminotransferase family protein [Iamia sp. SCSIO 61187]
MTAATAPPDVAALIVAAVEERSARGIAAAVSRLVSQGVLPPGARLPTVRQLATAVDAGATTVSEAWGQLGRLGVIEGRGRQGTFVTGPIRRPGPGRYRRLTAPAGRYRLDLSTGTPDVALLPDLAPVLARLDGTALTTSYLDRPVLPDLEDAVRARLPFPAEAVTVVDGALDALDRLASLHLRLGDRVLVENPAFPPLLDLLDLLGAEIVALPLDEAGIVPAALAGALDVDPVAVFLQPRSHNPTGTSMTVERARELAGLLAGRDVLVVEDDHSGAISGAEDVSLGVWLPDSTVHVTSFSKSYGPDLRLASVAGPAAVVDALVDRRLLGPGWSSRLLQAVLVELLDDPSATACVATAREVYAERRARVTAGLIERGVACGAGDGINLWVETPDEQATVVALASHGIAVAPGTPFVWAREPVDHVRVTVGLVATDHDRVAAALADAIGSVAPSSTANR